MYSKQVIRQYQTPNYIGQRALGKVFSQELSPERSAAVGRVAALGFRSRSCSSDCKAAS